MRECYTSVATIRCDWIKYMLRWCDHGVSMFVHMMLMTLALEKIPFKWGSSHCRKKNKYISA
jgi:hypothetical protein